MEDMLDKVVKLLAYISDKDLFAEFYRKRLSRRLLQDKSASDDHERAVLTRLKQQCGAQFTSKVGPAPAPWLRRQQTSAMLAGGPGRHCCVISSGGMALSLDRGWAPNTGEVAMQLLHSCCQACVGLWQHTQLCCAKVAVVPSTAEKAADVCLWRSWCAQVHLRAVSAPHCMLAHPRRWVGIATEAMKQRLPCPEMLWRTCTDGGHGDRPAAGAREAAGLRVLAALQQQVLAHRALCHGPHHRLLAGLQGAAHHTVTCHEQHLYYVEGVCLPAVQAARP